MMNMKNIRYNNMCLRVLVLLCLLMASVGAWAADYVFMNGNYFLGQTTAATTDFVPNASIYAGTSGGTFRNANNYYIRYNGGLQFSTTNSSNLTITGNDELRSGTYYYLNLNGTTWRMTYTTTNRATAYTVAKRSIPAGTYSDFSVIGGDYISSVGGYNYTHTNAIVDAACTEYTFNGRTYYSTDDAQAASTTQPTTEVTTGYVWSLNDNPYATVNATTGRITVNSLPTGDVDLTLTCTLNGTKSASKTVTLTKTPPVAAGYVIYNGSNYLNRSTAGTTTFNPNNCIWVGTSGNTFKNGEGYYLYRSNNNNNGTFQLSTTNSRSCTLRGTESGTTGQTIQIGTNTNAYLRYNDGWQTNATAGNVVFSVLKKTGAESSTAPTVSGDATIATLGNNNSYAHTDAAYTMGYNDYIFYDGAHHYWKSDDSEAIAGNTKPTAEEFTYTWSLSGNAAGHATVDPSTGVITYSTYYDDDTDVTLTLTATSANKTFTVNKTIQFQSPKNDPTGITATDMTLNVGEQNTITPTLTPNPCYTRLNFTSANTNIATVNATTGEVTGVAGGETTVTIKAYKYSAPTEYVQTTITVTVMEKVATPVIEFTPQGDGETASTTITCGTAGARIYYTTDGTTPTAYSTLYGGAFNVNNLDEVKAIAVKDGGYFTDSEEASATYSKHKMPTPTITIGGSGVSFTCPEDGASFYYTIDGSNPTTSSTLWDGTPFTPSANECTIKVIAVKAGSQNSDVAERPYVRASGVSGGTVYLNDFEDHTWTYYAGVDSEVDGGHYNTTYRAQGTTSPKYDAKIYSPNPRNVKITYNATNSASVSLTESENSFVYYKTLEQGTTEGQYPYQVISNPFSKRPAHSGTTYYGFAGWKIVKGGDYIQGHSNNDVLGLDEEITFVNLPYPSINCTSAEIVFETTWTTANRTYITTNPGSNQTYTFNSGTYETNFIVINVNYTRQITISGSATIMMVEPDGSADYRARAYSGALVPATGAANTTKIEFANWTATGTRDAYGRNLTIGRGMIMSTARDVVGSAQTGACNQVLKIESGNYGTFYHFTATPSSLTKQWITFGNDYDRAKKDWEGNNNTLNFSGEMRGAASRNVGKGSTDEMWRVVAKSGKYLTGVGGPQDAAAEQSYYIGVSGTHNNGHRYLEIQGGHWAGNISGGMGENHTPAEPAFTFRMRGGRIVGSIYGAAQYAGAGGGRTYILTGGEINGWVAAGANGTQSSGGLNDGASYVYVGGNAVVDSKHSATLINRSVGGNVYGAGCGYSGTSNSGEMTLGSNMVVADNAYIERGIYGGGAYGFVTNTQTSYIYITGGHVGGYTGQDYGSTTIQGGVYGGARQNKGGSAIIYMTGGLVETGIYGGSNNSGTMNGSVTMQINGGQVGTSTTPGNIHGGGYGQNTIISQNVDITLGKTGAARDADGVTVWGDVYGGSALGSVNGTAATNNYHTNVTMNAGYIHGSLYGGALGNAGTAANVYGPVQVKVYGGSVMNTDGTGANGSGAVYGANNINGAPQRSVTVDIYGTNSAPAEGEYALFAVYGGGNQANYTYGNGYPKVTVHNCDNSIEYVYGGGNAAAVSATDVTIYGGNKIGNVFGGGNGQVRAANVNGNTNVKIYGGTIGDVYGGSNTNGNITGSINVNVNAQAEGGSAACPVNIDNVYGGGNMAASNAGSITIGCAEHIGTVYGGANQADITGNITLNINSGHIDNVFGGNNTSGDISGNIIVNVNDNGSACGMEVGNVYGGGNQAAYGHNTDYPQVNILNGTITGSVFGGGLGSTAVVTGNPKVNINATTGKTISVGGSVFGGGSQAPVTGSTNVKVLGNSTVEGNVYGGGNQAEVTGTTQVQIGECN